MGVVFSKELAYHLAVLWVDLGGSIEWTHWTYCEHVIEGEVWNTLCIKYKDPPPPPASRVYCHLQYDSNFWITFYGSHMINLRSPAISKDVNFNILVGKEFLYRVVSVQEL